MTDGSAPGDSSGGGTEDTTPAPTFARGGLVGTMSRSLSRARDAWQGLAAGGFSFPRMTSGQVPGVGDGDTVPAALPSGSFVFRKAAAQFYGRAALAQLAAGILVRAFASGGNVGFGMNDRGTGTSDPKQRTLAEIAAALAKHNDHPVDEAPVIDPTLGYQPGDSFQGNLPAPVSFDTRQVPADLITARYVVEYAKEMLNAVGQTNPLLGELLPDMLDLLKTLSNNPSDTPSINALLQQAETIGANPLLFSMWGKTASSHQTRQPEWFYDFLTSKGLIPENSGASGKKVSVGQNSFAQKFFSSPGFGLAFYAQNPLAQIRKGSQLAQIAATFDQFPAFARGGQTSNTDTVNAMLTPGEYVIKAPTASVLGSDFLHALNNMKVPRADLEALINPPAPRASIPRFAEGGMVGGDQWPGRGSNWQGAPSTGGDVIVHIHVDPSERDAEDWVRRKVIPVLDTIKRRSGK